MKADSFFNFFDPPTIPDDPKAEVDEDTQVRPIQMWWLAFLFSMDPNAGLIRIRVLLEVEPY